VCKLHSLPALLMTTNTDKVAYKMLEFSLVVLHTLLLKSLASSDQCIKWIVNPLHIHVGCRVLLRNKHNACSFLGRLFDRVDSLTEST